jgi:4-carboxymuconolactone decarboxylase
MLRFTPAGSMPCRLRQLRKKQFGIVALGTVQYTTDILVRDFWLRLGLAPRDRSLVTGRALIAIGQVAQMPYHLHRAMDKASRKRAGR